MDEIIVTGYCRKIDNSRILCCEYDDDDICTDCLYPECEFKLSCKLIEGAIEKMKK